MRIFSYVIVYSFHARTRIFYWFIRVKKLICSRSRVLASWLQYYYNHIICGLFIRKHFLSITSSSIFIFIFLITIFLNNIFVARQTIKNKNKVHRRVPCRRGSNIKNKKKNARSPRVPPNHLYNNFIILHIFL